MMMMMMKFLFKHTPSFVAVVCFEFNSVFLGESPAISLPLGEYCKQFNAFLVVVGLNELAIIT